MYYITVGILKIPILVENDILVRIPFPSPPSWMVSQLFGQCVPYMVREHNDEGVTTTSAAVAVDLTFMVVAGALLLEADLNIVGGERLNWGELFEHWCLT